jgi:hypothetical protein
MNPNPYEAPQADLHNVTAESPAVKTTPLGNASEFVFDVRSLHTFSGDRKYRVYFSDGDFFCIRTGGQGLDPVAMQFGLIGVLIAQWFKRGDKTAAVIQQFDQTSPRVLLSQHKHNFSFRPADVLESTIDPAPLLPQHGVCFGRWLLKLNDGQSFKMQFENIEQMHLAVKHLPAKLGNALRVNVVWDPRKLKYRKP